MSERGGIISGFLVKVVISLLLVGFVAFEFGAIIVAKVQVDGIAVNAAQEAASQYGKDQNLQHAKKAASDIATTSGAELVSISVSPDGAIITVTVRKIAHTFLLQHIKKFANWRIATSTHQAGVH